MKISELKTNRLDEGPITQTLGQIASGVVGGAKGLLNYAQRGISGAKSGAGQQAGQQQLNQYVDAAFREWSKYLARTNDTDLGNWAKTFFEIPQLPAEIGPAPDPTKQNAKQVRDWIYKLYQQVLRVPAGTDRVEPTLAAEPAAAPEPAAPTSAATKVPANEIVGQLQKIWEPIINNPENPIYSPMVRSYIRDMYNRVNSAAESRRHKKTNLSIQEAKSRKKSR